MSDVAELTIGEVARRAGVATSLIRYYESIGLLPEPDRLHGQRRYDTDVLGRLAFIGVAQSAGFKLSEIKDLVGGIDDGDGLSDRIRSLSSPQARRGRGAARAHPGDEGMARGRAALRMRDAGGMRALPTAGRRRDDRALLARAGARRGPGLPPAGVGRVPVVCMRGRSCVSGAPAVCPEHLFGS